VWRTLDLDVAAGPEIQVLALGQFQHEFLDEGRDALVRAHPALHPLDAEYLARHLDLHVLLDDDLAREALPLSGFPLGHVAGFGRQDDATAFQDPHLALAAGPATATGGGNEQPGVGQRIEQLRADRRLQRPLLVDEDVDRTRGHQLRARGQDDEHQRQHDAGKHGHAEDDCEHGSLSCQPGRPFRAESPRKP
jgi:hypothetical protein